MSEPLDDIMREKFAQSLVKNNGNQTQAYKEVYPHVTESTASSHSSKLAGEVEIRKRVRDLLSEDGINIKMLNNRLKTHILDDEDKKVSLDATKFTYKLAGYIDAEKANANETHNHLHLHSDEVKQMTDHDKLDQLRKLME